MFVEHILNYFWHKNMLPSPHHMNVLLQVLPVHDTTFTQPTGATLTTSLDTHSHIKPHHTHTHTLPHSTSLATLTTSPDAHSAPQPHHVYIQQPSPTFRSLILPIHVQEETTVHQGMQDLPGVLMWSPKHHQQQLGTSLVPVMEE